MVETTVPTAEAHYLGQVPAEDVDRRRTAIRRFFAAGGFPTAALEDWRFSNLDGLQRTAWRRPAPEHAGEAPEWTADFEHRVLLSGGVPLTADYHEDGLALGELQLGDADRWAGFEESGAGIDVSLCHPLEVLNSGLFDCGFRVRLEAGREAGPLLLYSLGGDGGEPTMRHPRSLIELAPNTSLTVFEVHDGFFGSPGWTNPSTLCRLGENSRLRYVRVERETGDIAHTGRVTFRLERHARVHSTVLSLAGGTSRTDTTAVLAAEGAEAELEGLFLGVGKAKADQHTLAIHAARHTTSRQLFKNVLSDEASAVFDGKVVVAPGAIGTDASQANRNLLLSTKAAVHTRPRLEINADDVKCAHGAAIGRLDEDALFYLRSRGLGRMDSREILVRGFAGEVVEKVPVEAVRALAAAGLQRIRESESFAA